MRKRGPEKHTKQITLRIDARLMDQVRAQIREDGMRLTDVIQEGLLLALEEKGAELPQWTHQLPFILRRPLPEEAELIRGLAIMMVENEIHERTPEQQKIAELCEWFFLRANESPHAQACLDLYGKRKP